MSRKANHLARLPIGTTLCVELVDKNIRIGEDFPQQIWHGTLIAPWQGKPVLVAAESKGLMGLISKLAQQWSSLCPNSDMRRKLQRAEATKGDAE